MLRSNGEEALAKRLALALVRAAKRRAGHAARLEAVASGAAFVRGFVIHGASTSHTQLVRSIVRECHSGSNTGLASGPSKAGLKQGANPEGSQRSRPSRPKVHATVRTQGAGRATPGLLGPEGFFCLSKLGTFLDMRENEKEKPILVRHSRPARRSAPIFFRGRWQRGTF